MNPWESVLFPQEWDWFYSPIPDPTQAIGDQNKEQVAQATAIDPNNLPSDQYQKLLDGLLD